MAFKLGEALVKDSLITREQLKLALERQVIFGGKIGTNIVELGILKEKDLAAFLGKYFKVPAVEPTQLSGINAEVIACIPKESAEKYKAIPFRKDRNRLHVAMMDPRSMASADELRFITGFDIIPYVITELRFLHALEKYYGVERDLRYISTFGKEDEQDSAKEDTGEELRKLKEQFANAREKEEIIGIILSESKKISTRAAIFVLKGAKVVGWKGRGLSVENLEFEAPAHSTFGEVLSRRSFYRGPLLKMQANEGIIEILGGAPQDCLIIPIQIRDKVIALLYIDNGIKYVLDASLNYIHSIVTMASLGFEIVILRNKILAL